MNGSENSRADVRPAASLTSSLLARRGSARPAMRRQAIGGLLAVGAPHEDLGWNDMGEEHGEGSAGTPSVVAAVELVPDEQPPLVSPPRSPIAEQISALTERLKTPARTKTSKAVAVLSAKAPPASLANAGRKVAFTLRIDAERHLRLRLLSAMTHRSAQQLLTEALDGMIAQNEELRALAGQVEKGQAAPAGKGKRTS